MKTLLVLACHFKGQLGDTYMFSRTTLEAKQLEAKAKELELRVASQIQDLAADVREVRAKLACSRVRARSTMTRDRNLQFRSAVSLQWILLLFLQVYCVI